MQKLPQIIAFVMLTFTGFAQTSPHGGGLKTDCKVCHTSETWKVSKSINSFDHNTTSFKLTGQHQAVDCIICHKTLKFEEAKSANKECIGCHTDMHRNTLGPLCERCHDTNSWIIKNTITMHQMSRFPLEGNHLVLECASCHKSASNYQYEPLDVECISCHKKDYLATTNPNHQQSGYPSNCVECHAINATNWNTTSFDHSAFPLIAGHNISCEQCHKAGTFRKIATDCMSCHQVQFNAAKDHVASKFSTDCTLCHNSNNWLDATFDHSKTNFPLTGAHVSVDCASCHTTGYAGTSIECKTCHQAKYTATQTPNHNTAGISSDCKTCHTTSVWQPSSFNHSTTIFPLTGAHTSIVQCSSCHLGNTTSAKTDCISCHQVQYNGAKDHVASRFPTDCKMCHNSNNWLNATFNHSLTNFPLTGAHVSVECVLCHSNGYAGTSMECKTCHQAKYSTTQTPNHSAAGISMECKTCHSTSAWQPSSFNHGTTIFPLTGAHTSIVQCSACHLGNTTSAKTDCISCHQAQFTSAKDHVASKFPTDCKLCHNSVNWLQSTFNHSTTNFPLTEAHIGVDCASCHASGYVGTSTACNSCHSTDFNSTTNPNHKTLGLSVTCTDCHTTVAGWQPAKFPNHITYFALTGAHAAIANECAACHKGTYPNTPKTCYGCHAANYNATKNPAHVAAQFSTDCASCHTVNAWVPSTFNHTNYFPITTGKHTNISCVTCHTTPSNYTIFTCITAACHANAHNRSQGSAGCYKCHPQGKGGD